MNGEGLRTWNMEVHKNLVHQERILRVTYYWFRFPEATQIQHLLRLLVGNVVPDFIGVGHGESGDIPDVGAKNFVDAAFDGIDGSAGGCWNSDDPGCRAPSGKHVNGAGARL
jgi:hypothetical protein